MQPRQALPICTNGSTTRSARPLARSHPAVRHIYARRCARECSANSFQPHPSYTHPQPYVHPVEQSMATVIVRTLAAHLLGMMIGVPLLLLTIVALMIVVPVRLFFCLVARALPTRWRSRVHYTFALAPRSCDMWWPLSKHAGRRTVSIELIRPCSDAYASLVQCIVTLQSSIDLRTARQDILNKVIVPSTRSATYATHRG
jgi:hypothetical protein